LLPSLKKIKKKEVEIEIRKKTKTIENDFVFAMTGYQHDYDFLDKVGVKCQAIHS
jgi:thioredoxin reductase (NADPH)